MSLRVLIVGSQGFVGQHMISLMAARHSDALIHSGKFDITDVELTDAVLRDFVPDVCINLAAVSSITRAGVDPDYAWSVNLHGALNLANSLLKVNSAGTYIFASSSEIYGDTFKSGVAVEEHATLAPNNIYASTKAAADLALGAVSKQGLQVIRARPFNHIGPGQSPNFVVAAFASQLARIEAGLQPPVIKVGNLSAARDFLDVADVCRAYSMCVERRHSLGSNTIVNLCSGRARTIHSVLNDLIEIFNIDVDVQVDPALVRPVEVASAFGDRTFAKELLDWEPISIWPETLSSIAQYWRNEFASSR